MYQQIIAADLAKRSRSDIDPRHVEAYMRIEHPCLDALSPSQFREEITIAIECVDVAGKADAESAAQSFGL